MTDTQNPLLDRSFRIPFHRIRAEHVVPGIRGILEEARVALDELAESPGSLTWASTIEPLDRTMERVRRGIGPVQHLLAVAETPELRGAWKEVLPEVSRFWSWMYLHEGLWRRLGKYAETDEARALTGLRGRHLARTLRDFRRSGADLSPTDRTRLESLDVELSELQQKFSENVLDATADFSLVITDGDRLRGIPEDARARFRKRAREKGIDGWLLTLDQPSFEAVVKHGEDRDLREELHEAYFTRGTRDPWDNRPLIPRIVELRKEKARLLGYGDFPDYRLEEQMVKSGARARQFVEEMVERTRPYRERDLEELERHAESMGIQPLQPWDVSFVAEHLRRERFDLDEEALRPYFPLESVLVGFFEIVERLFGVRVTESELEEVWHPEVRYFELGDEDGALLGGFYTDFFPRPEKRQGAWMNDFIYGGPQPDGAFEPHLGVVCANFPPPGDDRPACLTHRDVETLFHEFGHLLHHLMCQVPIAQRGGINVAWDWVELPSQLLENWAWEREALDLFARHWDTGDRLPDDLFERMVKAKRFMGGWRQMRQLEFGMMDQALHARYEPGEDGDPVQWVTELLQSQAPTPEFAKSHPLPFFMHLFSGGYAASYYSYLWSEVLEADLFTRFQSEGIFHRPTGRRFVETILSAGDREDPEALFREFMGRDPDPEALLRRNLGQVA